LEKGLASLQNLKMPSHIHNPLLETRAPMGWMGNPLDASGRFVNLNFPFWPEFSKLLRWQTTRNPQKEEKKLENWLPDIQEDTLFLEKKEDCLIWLGHSSFFLRIAGAGILIDPVFGKASVVKRKIPFPHQEIIARQAQYLLISHDHRDHCDAPSLKKIAVQNPSLQVFTGLSMSPLLGQFFPKSQIQEAGWYQQFKIPNSDIQIWFLPSRHWSRRLLSDTNQRLWGGFFISSPKHNFYFMGDSGYDDHFEQIGSLFPKANFAIMGIGAYNPPWFMHSSHMTPEDSWKSFQNLGAEMFIPMHYGTFDLADEPLGEPLKRLKTIGESNKMLIPAVGQTIWI
jgi:L-ascorbate metabolism protein UlaG (beta-lactamase superfamily)